MEEFDIFDDSSAQPFLVDYQSRLRLGEEREVPSNEPIKVDPIKLNTAWTKAAERELKRAIDIASTMSDIEKIIKEYESNSGRWLTGYTHGKLFRPPSYMSYMSKTQPDVGIFSKLSDRYPIQPDPDTNTDSKD